MACGQRIRLEHLTTNRSDFTVLPCKQYPPLISSSIEVRFCIGSNCAEKVAISLCSRNLHSHHFSSPLTNQQEVSAFGELGEGDTGDVWKVGGYNLRDWRKCKSCSGGVRHRLLAARPGGPVQARGHRGLLGIQRPDLWQAHQWANGDHWHHQARWHHQVADPRGLMI